MKAITKKEFTKACFEQIKGMNNDELEATRKGLYTLYNKLKMNSRTIEFGNLNSNSAFLLDIACMAATEAMSRIKKEEELPY